MRTKFDLEAVANQIAEISGGTIMNQKKFEESVDEYFISGVTENMLLGLGFEYQGYTGYGVAPYYIKENIMCYFDDVVLHVMEMTYSVFNTSKEENNEEIEPEIPDNTESNIEDNTESDTENS